MDLYSEMRRRYDERDLPWDQALPPPEIIAFAESAPPGRALDLGCGTGRASIYLAQHGWICDGVDFIPAAVDLARERATAAGVGDSTRFTVAEVAHLDEFKPSYDLAIDVGCMHNLRGDDLVSYAAGVARLVHADGQYLLFAHLADETDQTGETAPARLTEADIRSVFDGPFSIERAERGTTTVGEMTWASAWFWMRRTA
jgi:cyclopropane fatty-acyl-phospholipid synthase-like methyltransferase